MQRIGCRSLPSLVKSSSGSFLRRATALPKPSLYNNAARFYAVDPTPDLDAYEQQLFTLLNKELDPEVLNVKDVSGGCGSMFAINIVSDKFNGLSLIKQQRLVNEVLKDEITKWHGLQLRTKALEKYNK
jgi:stress-induced morphogen